MLDRKQNKRQMPAASLDGMLTVGIENDSPKLTCATCRGPVVSDDAHTPKRNIVTRAASRISAVLEATATRTSASPKSSPKNSSDKSPGSPSAPSAPTTPRTSPGSPAVASNTESPSTPSKRAALSLRSKAPAPKTPIKSPTLADATPTRPLSTHTPACTPPYHLNRPRSSHSHVSAAAYSTTTTIDRAAVSDIRRAIRNDADPKAILKAIENMPNASDAALWDIFDEAHAVLISSRNGSSAQWEHFQDRATLFPNQLPCDAALTDRGRREADRRVAAPLVGSLAR